MPEPLATPVTAPFPDLKGMLASLARVSVVTIASANLRKCSEEEPAESSSGFNRALILAVGNGTPIMPVEEGNTSYGLALSNWAVSEQIRLQSRTPAAPVAQFAVPEFTITARTRPPG